MNGADILAKIRKEICESGRDERYRPAAYAFVLNGLEFYLTKIGEKRHITGQELTRGLVEFAVKQFGPMTLDVLRHWGIHSTLDFGCIVYNLIDIGLLSKKESDSIDDFADILDIPGYVEQHLDPVVDPGAIRGIRGA